MNSHSCMIGSNSLKDLKSGVVKVCAGMFTRPHFQALRWLWLGSGTQSPLQNEKHDERFQVFSDFHTQMHIQCYSGIRLGKIKIKIERERLRFGKYRTKKRIFNAANTTYSIERIIENTNLRSCYLLVAWLPLWVLKGFNMLQAATEPLDPSINIGRRNWLGLQVIGCILEYAVRRILTPFDFVGFCWRRVVLYSMNVLWLSMTAMAMTAMTAMTAMAHIYYDSTTTCCSLQPKEL